MNVRAFLAKIWNAVTRHRFSRLADLSAKRGRGEQLGARPRLGLFDGDPSSVAALRRVDKSPAESGENSPHSITPWLRLRRAGQRSIVHL
jgi:hypothetical protein